jgi:fructose-1,6-bisphosphatase/inositol monophosphatase family enzyme
VLEWCWLAAGRIQLYLHGGQKLWDFAAGYLILLEAGGAATTLSGMPLDCSKLRKRSVVAAVNKDLLDQWEEWINTNSEISQSAPF